MKTILMTAVVIASMIGGISSASAVSYSDFPSWAQEAFQDS